MIKEIFKYIKTLIIVMQLFNAIEAAGVLPNGFVYLKDFDPTIIQNLRYYDDENFVGIKIEGYKSDKVILSREAAVKLATVQKELLADGYSLVIYDAYRPQKAVNHFMKWSEDLSNQVTKGKYYPLIDKSNIFNLGYVAEKSGHSRGSTVDLTIIKSDSILKKVSVHDRKLLNDQVISYLDDGTVDMGSSFDLFDKASHHDSKLIDKKYLGMRNYLRAIMKKNGFKEYEQEWWHYTLENEPFLNTYFNFDIE